MRTVGEEERGGVFVMMKPCAVIPGIQRDYRERENVAHLQLKFFLTFLHLRAQCSCDRLFRTKGDWGQSVQTSMWFSVFSYFCNDWWVFLQKPAKTYGDNVSIGVCVVRSKKKKDHDWFNPNHDSWSKSKKGQKEMGWPTTALKLGVWHCGHRHLCFMEPEMSLIGWEGGAGEDVLMIWQRTRCGSGLSITRRPHLKVYPSLSSGLP